MPSHLVIDGSNIATEGRSLPSLKQLDEAVQAFLEERPHDVVTVVVDATFEHRIDASERRIYDEALEAGELLTPPAGTIGRGDKFILQIADRADATVFSNDSFQEFHGDYAWLFDEGRLVGGKPVPHVGWIFTERTPVRGPKSRQATRAAAKRSRPATAKSEPVVKAPPRTLPDGSKPKVGDRYPTGGPTPAPAGRADASSKASRRRRSGTSSDAINEPLPFIEFIADNRPGSVVEGEVVEFSSHGAYVQVGQARCYVPLRSMGDPAPRSAREVLERGEVREFVVQSLDAPRRGIDLALPGFEDVDEIDDDAVDEVVADAEDAVAEELAAVEGVTAEPPRGRGRGRRRTTVTTDEVAEQELPAAAGAVEEEEEEAAAPPARRAKKAAAKKTATKKATAKKAATRRSTAKKAAAEPAADAAVEEVAVVEAPPEEAAAAPKRAARKTAAKKASTSKRPAAKKAAAKKAASAPEAVVDDGAPGADEAPPAPARAGRRSTRRSAPGEAVAAVDPESAPEPEPEAAAPARPRRSTRSVRGRAAAAEPSVPVGDGDDTAAGAPAGVPHQVADEGEAPAATEPTATKAASKKAATRKATAKKAPAKKATTKKAAAKKATTKKATTKKAATKRASRAATAASAPADEAADASGADEG